MVLITFHVLNYVIENSELKTNQSQWTNKRRKTYIFLLTRSKT